MLAAGIGESWPRWCGKAVLPLAGYHSVAWRPGGALGYHLGPVQGFKLAHPKIPPIYELLGLVVKELVFWN